jgi:polyisoprenoid-binding protein YceI
MRYLASLFLCIVVLSAQAQKYTAEKAFISFYSHAVVEDITAENTKVSTIFNEATSEIVFSVPMKEFKFAKSLMQEHFNEKYVESEKYPKATFQGVVAGYDPKATGVQNVKAQGKLTIHGVTKDIDVPGTIEVKGNKRSMKSKFMVKVADYNITIPTLVFQNIAEEVEVTIDFLYKPL